MHKSASHHHSIGQDLFHELVTEGMEKQAGFSAKAARGVMGEIRAALGRGEQVGRVEIEKMVDGIISKGLKSGKKATGNIPKLRENILRRVNTNIKMKTRTDDFNNKMFGDLNPLSSVKNALKSKGTHVKGRIKVKSPENIKYRGAGNNLKIARENLLFRKQYEEAKRTGVFSSPEYLAAKNKNKYIKENVKVKPPTLEEVKQELAKKGRLEGNVVLQRAEAKGVKRQKIPVSKAKGETRTLEQRLEAYRASKTSPKPTPKQETTIQQRLPSAPRSEKAKVAPKSEPKKLTNKDVDLIREETRALLLGNNPPPPPKVTTPRKKLTNKDVDKIIEETKADLLGTTPPPAAPKKTIPQAPAPKKTTEPAPPKTETPPPKDTTPPPKDTTPPPKTETPPPKDTTPPPKDTTPPPKNPTPPSGGGGGGGGGGGNGLMVGAGVLGAGLGGAALIRRSRRKKRAY